MTSEQSFSEQWSDNAVFILGVLFIAAPVLIRIPELWERIFDPDEFEHLHAAYCIATGGVPYRDFFEHHPPLFWLFLQPLYWLGARPESLLIGARVMAGLMTLGIIGLTYELGRYVWDKRTGVIGGAFLANILLFLQKSFESRPDVPEVLLLLLSVRLLLPAWRLGRFSLFFWSGTCAGFSFLCSQKVLFPLLGIVAVWLMTAFLAEEDSKDRARQFLWYAAGFLAPFTVTVCVLASLDAWFDFLYRCFLFNAQWKIHVSPLPVCMEFVRQNPIIFSLGLVAILKSLGSVEQSASQNILLGTVLGGVVGIGLIPVVQRQYLLLVFPFWSLFAAHWLIERIRAIDAHGERGWDFILAGTLGVSLALGSPKFFGYFARFVSLWAFLLLLLCGFVFFNRVRVKVLYSIIVVVIIGSLTPLNEIGIVFWVVAFTLSAIGILLRRCDAVLVILLAGIIGNPLSHAAKRDYVHNAPQRAYIRIVAEETGPNDCVFDGWSGYGFFRPHAYYYYFLHREIRAMLTEEELGEDIVRALRRVEPEIVIYDENIHRLGEEVRAYIQENYRAMGVGNLYRRVD